jgi:hypothetical protein
MSTSSNDKRIYWINHQGVPILVMDFSHATPAESLAAIDGFVPAIISQPKGSVRMLTDVTEASYEPSISNKWKAVRLQYDAYFHASAIFGLSGLVGVAVRSMVDLMALLNIAKASRKVRIFKTKDQALAWLAKA